MSRTKNVKNGVFAGGINFILGIVCPFITRTIIIHYLGNEYLGLNTLFSSILQVLSLTELGFGTSIAYLLYEPVAHKNVPRINKLLYFYKRVYIAIGILILCISFVLLFFLDTLVKGDCPSNVNLYVLFGIYVANTTISYFLFAYKRVLLSAHQHYDIEMIITIIASATKYIIQIVGLISFRNYYFYAIAIPFGTIMENIVCSVIVDRLFPWCKPKGSLEKSEVFEILKNTGGAFCSKIGSMFFLSVDSIVISAFLGLYVLGTYNNYFYVISMFIMFFAVIHNAIRPVIGNYWATENNMKNWRVFKMINTGYMMIVTIVCGCTLPLLQKFEILWGGEANTMDKCIVYYLILYFYVGRLSAIPTLYLEATGILWQGKLVPLISSVLNLFLNIILVQKIGVKGVLISSIIATLFVTIPGYIRVLNGTIFRENNYVRYITPSIIIQIVQALLICIGAFFLDAVLSFDNTWINFIAEGILLMIYGTIAIVILNLFNNDFKELKIFLKMQMKKA